MQKAPDAGTKVQQANRPESCTSEFIVLTTQACSAKFADLLDVSKGSHIWGHWLEDQEARFNLWIEYSGLYADGYASIRWTLSHSKELPSLILQLLNALNAKLTYCIDSRDHTEDLSLSQLNSNRLNELPSPSDQDDKESLERQIETASETSSFKSLSTEDDNEFDSDRLSEAFNDIEDTISRLNRTRVLIRKLGSNIADEELKSFTPRDRQGNDMTDDFTNSARKLIKYGLSTSKLTSEFQSRLVESVVRRWRRFSYHQHLVNLSSNTTASPATTQWKPRHPEPEARIIVPLSRNSSSSSLDSSLSDIELSSNMSRKLDLVQKPQPVGTSDIIECPYCFLSFHSREFDDIHWKDHFLKDLAPYLCVFEQCMTPQLTYSEAQTWVEHMLEEHMNQVWICTAHPNYLFSNDPRGMTFHTEEAYKEHVAEDHPEIVQQLPLLVHLSAKASSRLFTHCSFCEVTLESLALKLDKKQRTHQLVQEAMIEHIKEHLLDIALISLISLPQGPSHISTEPTVDISYHETSTTVEAEQDQFHARNRPKPGRVRTLREDLSLYSSNFYARKHQFSKDREDDQPPKYERYEAPFIPQPVNCFSANSSTSSTQPSYKPIPIEPSALASLPEQSTHQQDSSIDEANPQIATTISNQDETFKTESANTHNTSKARTNHETEVKRIRSPAQQIFISPTHTETTLSIDINDTKLKGYKEYRMWTCHKCWTSQNYDITTRCTNCRHQNDALCKTWIEVKKPSTLKRWAGSLAHQMFRLVPKSEKSTKPKQIMESETIEDSISTHLESIYTETVGIPYVSNSEWLCYVCLAVQKNNIIFSKCRSCGCAKSVYHRAEQNMDSTTTTSQIKDGNPVSANQDKQTNEEIRKKGRT